MRDTTEGATGQSNDVLTVAEVGRRLRLSTAKVYALTKSGELECYRFGRIVRISEIQLRQYLASAKHEVTRFSPSTSRHF